MIRLLCIYFFLGLPQVQEFQLYSLLLFGKQNYRLSTIYIILLKNQYCICVKLSDVIYAAYGTFSQGSQPKGKRRGEGRENELDDGACTAQKGRRRQDVEQGQVRRGQQVVPTAARKKSPGEVLGTEESVFRILVPPIGGDRSGAES